MLESNHKCVKHECDAFMPCDVTAYESSYHQNKLSVVPVLVSSDPLGFCRVVLSEISLLRNKEDIFLTPSVSFTHI